MKLDEYLFRNKITQRKFAETVGVTAVYIGSIVHDKKLPGYHLAVRIKDATDGQVLFEEVLNKK